MTPLLALALAQTATPAITLRVDAREAPRGLYHVQERIPVRPGPLTLRYPKYIPGEHAPTGPINSIIKFVVLAHGRPLVWQRDPVDMFTIRVKVPADTTEIEVNFDQGSQSEEGNSGSPYLARIKWNRLVWSPARPSDNVRVQASLNLPPDWHWASALEPSDESKPTVNFRPVSLTRLVDSPVQIGRYYRRYDVTGKSPVKHYLEVMADSPDALKASPAMLTHLTRIHEDAEAITGSRHYNAYRWLVTLSDEGGSEGLEHHESSENGEDESAFTSAGGLYDLGDLLSHEYFHSFNGKFRRPIGLATPDFQAPMKSELLWIYEGLTQFTGQLLPCRAGWWTQAQWRDQMALNYSMENNRRGRDWRPLADTAVAAQITYSARGAWANARRQADYYVEMTVIWLEVDMMIRKLTHDQRSIFDFIRRFHGGPARGPELKPYAYADVIRTLNDVAPCDWDWQLRHAVYDLQPTLSPLGFTLAGWKLVYNSTPNEAEELAEELQPGMHLATSIGVTVNDGSITDVNPGSPAEAAGIAPGAKILAVNGRRFTAELLQKAVGATAQGEGLELTLDTQQSVRTVRLNYHGGLRYPHLERIPGTRDRLKDLLTRKI